MCEIGRHHIKKKKSRSSVVKKRTSWSFYFEGDVKVPEICIPSVVSQCPDEKEGCRRLHAMKKWHWQLMHNGRWYNFLGFHSDLLEGFYKNVDSDAVLISFLNAAKMKGKTGQKLVQLLGSDYWRADIRRMEIVRLNPSIGSFHKESYPIRRLSTSSAEKFKSEHSTEFRWFFQDEKDGWIEFARNEGIVAEPDSGSSPSRSSLTTSSEIEKQYLMNPKKLMVVHVAHGECKVDLLEMEMMYKKSKKIVPVRRRPRNDDVVCPTVWSYSIQGDVQILELCTSIIGENCSIGNGCGKLHSKSPWVWQFCCECIWYNIPIIQGRALEKEYLDVRKDSAEMPAIDCKSEGGLNIFMRKILGEGRWLAKFDSMTMTSKVDSKIILEIRRLCYPVALSSDDQNAAKFSWYFKDKESNWIEFGSIKSENQAASSLTSSYDIEKCYKSKKWKVIDILTENGAFELSFSSMSLQDKNTKVNFPVRRRPHHQGRR